MRSPDKHLYSFGPYHLDTSERMLLRDGQYVPLTPKALETLTVLVEHGGRIVDKEELLRQVWPDTFVEEVTLAKSVSTLRKVLGDSQDHHYIETIPKRGYRFVAEVRTVEPVTTSAPPEPTPAPAPAASMPHRRAWFLAPAVIAAAVLLLWIGSMTRRSTPAPPSLKTVPLTSFPGQQNQAAFSPDGNQIAFVRDGARPDTTHIFAKVIGSESVLQLTDGASADSKPAWSPDGRSITFLRSSGTGRAWYQIAALGGAERKIAEVFPYFDLGNGNSPYLSPDGKSVAIVDKNAPGDPAAIFLLSLADFSRRKLTSPPTGTTGDYYPAFSPDGKLLAFARAISFSATDLFVMPVSGSNPKRLTFDGLTIDGLTWTPDSREVVFSSRRGGSINSLWRIPVSGGTPERVSIVGENVISPAVARNQRLAYTRVNEDMNIWSISLGDGAKSGVQAAPLITSTFRDSDPDYSPDGSRIAFTSGRAGGFGIWVAASDGSNPHQLFDGGPYVTGSPRWSPDGQWIAFDSRANDPATSGNPSVWIIGAEGRPLRRLPTDASGAVAPSWSRDGRWIYFASPSSGTLQIWKIPSAGGAAVQVTRGGGFEGFESSNGQYLYYLKGRAAPGIWRVRVGGGQEELVTDKDQAGLWRSWRVAGSGAYFATGSPGPRLSYVDFATGNVRVVSQLGKPPDLTIPGMAVSPDGRRILYAQYDQSGSNVMMVEGFR